MKYNNATLYFDANISGVHDVIRCIYLTSVLDELKFSCL